MSGFVRLLVLSVVVGCNGSDPTDLPTPMAPDADGDGVSAATDCDDDDPGNYPGNEELCDGRDNDCDTLVDEAVTSTFYRDEDGDGYGAVGNPTQACEAPDGFVDDASDCNDVDPAFHPGAEERCDPADRDCDGQAQNDAVDATFWYLDADLDGFGLDGTPLVACDDPGGRVANFDDCDDGRPEVHPGADELCNDRDDDCDQLVDEDAIDALPAYLDADGDGFGDPGDVLYVCVLPADRVANNVDCDDLLDTVNPSAEDVCGDGLDNDCNLVVDDGTDRAWYADADLDGFGAGDVLAMGCDGPAGAVDNADDCNDDVDTIFPGAHEQCNGLDDDCDQVVPADELDGDHDGVRTCDGDCDDTLASVRPGTEEVCDGGVDNDCDPATDEELLPTTPTWFTDGDLDGYGDAHSGVQACVQPVDTVADGTDCDDHDMGAHPGAHEVCGDGIDNDCDGQLDETCVVDHCGAITADEVWTAGSVHQVTCDIEVGGPSAPTLTIEDGAIVEFATGAHLRVGQSAAGRLLVQGDTTGVTFTSAELVPIPGAWDGVRLAANDSGSVIDGLTVRYAGGGTSAGLLSSAPSVTVSDSSFSDGLGDGLRVDSGAVAITGSTFASNTDFGVQLASAATLLDFDGNTLTGNTSGPLQLGVAQVGRLDAASVYSGNTTDRVHVLGGVVEQSAVWPALDVPYFVASTVNVSGPLSPELRIEDGVELVFAATAQFRIATSNRGRLLVDGSTVGVDFRGEQAVRGYWGGLFIGSDDLGTELRHLELRDAGRIGGGVLLSGADVLVEDCVLENNDGHGLDGRSNSVVTMRRTTLRDNAENGLTLDGSSSLAAGAHGTPSFVDNVVVDNGAYPVSGPAIVSLELDPSSTFASNGDDLVRLTSDTLDRSGSWRALDVPYLLTGSVNVQGAADPVLTVDDGVVAYFESNVALYVASSDDGTLLAQGGATGILFTSADPSPVAGAWRSVSFGPNDQGSSLTNTTLEYGGGLTGAVVVTNSSPVIDGVTIAFSASDGIDVSGSTARPIVRNSTIVDNAGYGIEVRSGGDLPLDGGPTFVGNVLSGNDVPARMPAWSARSVGVGVYDDNLTDVIELTGGTIDQDVTLRSLGVPFRLLADTWVQGALDPTLTVEGGVTLQMAPNVDLRVAPLNDGALVVDGTELSPVLITSSLSPANPGDWGQIQLGDHDLGSRMTWTTVEYGGGNGQTLGALQVESDALVLDHVTSRLHENNGLRGTGATLSITNSTFADNLRNGVYLDGSTVLLDSHGNVFDGNQEAPMVLPADHAGQLDAADDYGDNGSDAVMVLADSVEQTQTWANLGVPYRVLGEVNVDGPADPVLTIADGTTLLFDPGAGLVVGRSDDGTLLVDGHDQGVTLTSSAAVPAPGDWRGVTIGSSDQGSVIAGATLTYAGDNGLGNLYSESDLLVVRDSVVAWSSHDGIRLSGSLVDLTGTRVEDNADDGLHATSGDAFVLGADPTVTDTTFTRNGGYALSIRPDDVRQLDPSSSFTGNGAGIRVWGGDLTASGVWEDHDVPYTLAGSMDVEGPADPVLTLADGVEVQVHPGTDLDIGSADDGGLIVQGDVEGVVITSAGGTTPGAWRSLRLNSRTTVADITGLTVEFGGGGAQGNVYVGNTDADFDGLISRFSASDGLRAVSSDLVVTNSRFADNNEDGVDLATSVRLLAPFAGNTLTGNGGPAIRLPAAEVDQLVTSSSFAGNGGPIAIYADTVETSGTWLDLDAPYRLDGSIQVRGSDSPVLTLADGVEIVVDGLFNIDVGTSQPGGLIVDGHTAGVWIGSSAGTPGAWQGLVAGTSTTVFDLFGLTIEDGGGSNLANVYVSGASATMIEVVSRNSARDGVYVRSGAELEAVDSHFVDNNDNGVRLDTLSSLVALTGGPSFVGNTLSGNTLAPIVVNPADLGQLDPSNTFVGNGLDVIEVGNGTVSTSAVWFAHDVGYRATGDISIRGALDPVVTLEPGVTMAFDANRTLHVGQSDGGGLVTSNTTADPVVFTSSATSPLAGDWRGLYFNAFCIAASVDLDNVVVEYAGSTDGAVRFNACDGRLANSTISHSATNGVRLYNSAAPTLDNVSFDNIGGDDVAP